MEAWEKVLDTFMGEWRDNDEGTGALVCEYHASGELSMTSIIGSILVCG